MVENDSSSLYQPHPNFDKFYLLELDIVADSTSADDRYIKFQKYAFGFFKILSKKMEMDIPYLKVRYFAMTIVDHLHLKGTTLYDCVAKEEKHLFLTCCFTLSWKSLDDGPNLVSNLVEKLVGADFTKESIDLMETHIAEHLNPNLKGKTPFCYIEDYVFFKAPLSWLLFRSLYQLMAISQTDIGFTKHRPSVIGAACVVVFLAEEFSTMTRLADFEKKVIGRDFEAVLRGEINECQRKLKPMYDDLCNAQGDEPSYGHGEGDDEEVEARSDHGEEELAAAAPSVGLDIVLRISHCCDIL